MHTHTHTLTVISYAAVHYSALTPPVGGEGSEGVLTMGNDSALTPHMHPPPHDEVHLRRRGRRGRKADLADSNLNDQRMCDSSHLF